MLFKYRAKDPHGVEKDGSVDALNIDSAISSLQRRGFVISHISPADKKKNFLELNITFFERVSNKDVVILSRQMATLFEAQVSALRVFRLLAGETVKPALGRVLVKVSDDLQSGASISKALSAHPKVFSSFYVNMVRSGEESGKLDEVFNYLADYLDRTYAVTTKTRNALIYPAFIIFTFVVVMILMLTKVIPQISEILLGAGEDIPIYTKIVIGFSEFMLNYGPILLVILIIGAFFGYKYYRTPGGKYAFDKFKVTVPLFSGLYRKLYLSRLTDNLSTLLTSGIPISKSIDITSTVIGNKVYENVLTEAGQAIRTGSSISDAYSVYRNEIPGIVVQMIKVGEESGELGKILKTLADFYNREVETAVDTLVDLIEPIMIIVLGVGVAILLAAVILPIYNISSAIV